MADCLHCDRPNDDDSREFYVCASCAVEPQTKQENERLRDCLQWLYDLQNDAPLERDREDWERVMGQARQVLKGGGEQNGL